MKILYLVKYNSFGFYFIYKAHHFKWDLREYISEGVIAMIILRLYKLPAPFHALPNIITLLYSTNHSFEH